jgi:hypothetical protein
MIVESRSNDGGRKKLKYYGNKCQSSFEYFYFIFFYVSKKDFEAENSKEFDFLFLMLSLPW